MSLLPSLTSSPIARALLRGPVTAVAFSRANRAKVRRSEVMNLMHCNFFIPQYCPLSRAGIVTDKCFREGLSRSHSHFTAPNGSEEASAFSFTVVVIYIVNHKGSTCSPRLAPFATTLLHVPSPSVVPPRPRPIQLLPDFRPPRRARRDPTGGREAAPALVRRGRRDMRRVLRRASVNRKKCRDY